MSKSVIVLGLEGRAIRGVRLAESGKDFVRAFAGCWPLDAALAAADEATPPPGGASVAPDASPTGGDLPAVPAAPDVPTAELVEEDKPLARAFRAAKKQFHVSEVALSLPLSRLLVKVLRFPVDARDDLDGAVALQMDKLSPFPDEALTVGHEIVRETESDLFVAVAALPDAVSLEIGAALEAARLRVVRTDATALGWLRSLWPKLEERAGVSRRLVLLDLDDGWDLVVLDDGAPVVLRGLGSMSGAAELGREVTLSLMEAELGAGPRPVGDVVVCTKTAPAADVLARLAAFGPVRTAAVDDEFGGVEGAARRAAEGATFDVTPAAWVVARQEARFKRHLAAGLAAAFGVWGLALLVLFGGPFVYGKMSDHERALSKRHAVAYRAVADMRERVKLVRRYSDHARGALEVLKTVSDRLPEGVTLTGFQYRHEESAKDGGVKASGEAEQPTEVYAFADALRRAGLFEGGVTLHGPSASRGGLHKFDVDSLFDVQEKEGKE